MTGRVQLIDLERVRLALGPRWPEAEEGAFAAAERIVIGHLSRGAVCSRTEEGFLICFAEADAATAPAKARAIAREIETRILGHDAPPPAAEAVPESAEPEPVPTPRRFLPKEAIAAAIETRMAFKRADVEATAVATARDGLVNDAIEFAAARPGRIGALPPLLLARMPHKVEGAIATLQALGQPTLSSAAELALLVGCAQRLLAELERKATELLLTPVRLSTLSRRLEAERWLGTARSVGALGKQRLVAEVTGLSREIVRARLTDATMMLAPLCRLVAFELPSVDRRAVELLPGGTLLATLPATRLGTTETARLEAATRLVQALAARNCRLLVKGVEADTHAASLEMTGAMTAPAAGG